MIPKTLQIKNFLSYGPEQQTIDFLSYSLICLSGKNGHGKSALLDAMTWALWGQARKTTGTSKADEGLVHLGQKHMLVTFDFEINGIAYRVRREFVKTQSTPFSALDFGIVKQDGTFTTLTDKTIKLTQEKLEKTIGITFESFVNSAFLRQGQANEFSKKSPKERKEILATILQLNRFEDLKKAALDKSKILQQSSIQKQSIIDRICKEINDLEEALQEHELVTAQLQAIHQEEEKLLTLIQQDELTKVSLLEKNKKYEFLQVQKSQKAHELTEVEQNILQLEKKFQEIEHEQKTAINITNIEEEHKKIRSLVAMHQEKLNKRLELKDQYLSLQEKKQALEKELTQLQASLTQNYEIATKVLQEQIQQHHNHVILQEKKLVITQEELKKDYKVIEQEEADIQAKKKHLEILHTYEKQFEEHKNQYQLYKAQSLVLEQQILDVEKKYTLSLNNQDPSCPLCEQNLSASRKKFLEQKFNQNTTQLHSEWEKIKKDLVLLQKTLTEEHATLIQYKKEQENLTKQISHLDARKDQVIRIKAHLTQEEQQCTVLKTKIIELQTQLEKAHAKYKQQLKASAHHEKEVAYETLVKKIEALKQTAQTLAYNKEEHEKEYKHLQEIETTLQRYQTLQKDLAQQEQRRHQINELDGHRKKIDLVCKNLDQELINLQNCPALLVEHLKLEQAHKQTYQNILAEKSQLLNKKAIFDLHTQKSITLKQEQHSIEKEIKIINAEINDFIEIAKALGKDGLQALLIEQALPEIEQEANILLAQLTDNQTQIFIESLRDLKKGGSKETLDIKISDAIGVRSYEMFSGGEAFRIDFALRIAISKLLARRAGTALQTLIIDEGFGSQDDDGLQLIMDSILKIQDNFAKVIIVSHLPSMKEQFPVQFLVQKKASGSTVTVIQQG